MHVEGHQELIELIKQYEAAFNSNDAYAMNELFATDPVFVNFAGHMVLDKGVLLKAQQAVFSEGGPLADIDVSYTVERVTYLASDIAAVHSRQQSQRPDRGAHDRQNDPMEAVFLVVLRRTEAGWRIVLGQNTPVAH
ncbi:SgcJ/EcaC family oxidoreductase [Actinoplanes sp. M2I2]|uniref:SgcJ/EcaC family oxidoreductase n=1 Tax=Actinoplanes sp. M2I2 TaxID=1734444 RepID=UPI002020F4DD|nr:SgcJ/EcaC family oxidoreductase [Actinoplanes sp. M2I2]